MAAETPEIVAAGQPEKKVKKTAFQARKRKTAEAESATDTPAATPEDAEIVSDSPEVPPAKETASRGRKRKSADDDAAAGAPSKKLKKETGKTAKPRQPKRTKKVAAREPSPPPVPSPVEVTAPVQAKIDAVKSFLATEMAHEDSMLERPSRQNPNFVSIPELDLLGVIMTMYFHYQLGHAETEASLSDVEEAITDRYRAPLHTSGDVDWVTLDLSIPTAFETRIKEKIAHHGLEDVSLLEVEMELCARQHRAQRDVYQWEAEKIIKAGDYLKDLVELVEDGLRKKREVELLKGSDMDGREEGRIGVCPKPAIEVV